MISYEYPKLSEEWNHWMLMVRIYDALNIDPVTNVEPDRFYQGLTDAGGQITLIFNRELTAEEKTKLDAVMNDVNSGLYPISQTGFTVFEISDIFDKWRVLESILGVKIKWIFCNVPAHDKLEVWIEGDLSAVKKKKLMDVYAELIKEKVG